MRFIATPTIHESPDECHRLPKTSGHPLLHRHMHLRFLVASGQATTRTQIGNFIGYTLKPWATGCPRGVHHRCAYERIVLEIGERRHRATR
jgi:hypothetical protein